MQKKVIALAVAGLVSGVAFAQSNVTVYGIVDMDYMIANKSINAGSKTFTGINSNGQNGSRLGFKGVEDLGNGLSATFRLEMGLSADTGASGQGRTFGRWATVGLAGKSFGEFQFGRRDLIGDEFMGKFDAAGNVSLAQHANIWGTALTARYTNAAVWISPNWNGVELKAAYSTNQNDDAATGADVEPARNATASQTYSNRRQYDLSGTYTNGPLVVGATYTYNKMQQVDRTVAGVNAYDGGNVWQVGGAYDFNVVRLSAAYARSDYEQNTQLAGAGTMDFGGAAETRDDTRRWLLGLSAPIGTAGKLAVSYGKVRTDFTANATPDAKDTFIGLAYFHNLSKRTSVYTAYAHHNNNDQAKISNASNNRYTVRDSNGGVVGCYEQAFQVGLRHSF